MPESVAHAVIGGSGLYSLFTSSTEIDVRTPYGEARVALGELGGRRVAFLARHGAGHSLAPHLINYRANIWALASLGVRSIISTAAVGGLHPDYGVGSLVLTDQYLDRTHGRADTFFDGESVQHLASADPFCPTLHAVAARALAGDVIPTGTVAVIQGPRFSTRAESEWFRAAGAHIVNMTLYPEVPLAAELSLGTVNLAFVTDSDAAEGDEPVTAELVFARLSEAQPRIIRAIESILDAIPHDYRARDLISPAAVEGVLAR